MNARRIPYVGRGADGCLRSAQIDREEADTLPPDRIAARDRLLASATLWEEQAQTEQDIAPDDYDPTDAELGVLAIAWDETRRAVKVNPKLTDGLD